MRAPWHVWLEGFKPIVARGIVPTARGCRCSRVIIIVLCAARVASQSLSELAQTMLADRKA